MSTTTTTTTTAATALLTAEQFGVRPDSDSGRPEELVRGRIVPVTPPNRQHGAVCCRVARILADYIDRHDLGHALSNDAGIITRRNPDTVRGADFAFYSYERLPRGPLAPSYGPELPELVVEVRSPNDRWRTVLEKVAEYLGAGVVVVIVIDPEAESVHVYRDSLAPQTLHADDELTLPDVLGDFRVRVAGFFESSSSGPDAPA